MPMPKNACEIRRSVAAAVAGVAPVRDSKLPETYIGCRALMINIPILNGGLFKARREEAELHAAAAGKDVQDLSVQIARDVRVAWLDCKRCVSGGLDVTARIGGRSERSLAPGASTLRQRAWAASSSLTRRN